MGILNNMQLYDLFLLFPRKTTEYTFNSIILLSTTINRYLVHNCFQKSLMYTICLKSSFLQASKKSIVSLTAYRFKGFRKKPNSNAPETSVFVGIIFLKVSFSSLLLLSFFLLICYTVTLFPLQFNKRESTSLQCKKSASWVTQKEKK